MRIWKIRNSEGLFSTGSFQPKFTKSGKSWQQYTHLEAHLRQFFDPKSKYHDSTRPRWVETNKGTYDDCDVVEYELVEAATESVKDTLSKIISKDENRKLR